MTRPMTLPMQSNRLPPRRRRGFTLIEMLVTVGVTLLMVFAVVSAFEWVGNSARDGRSLIELSGHLRGVEMLLQADLDNVTVPVRPWSSTSSALGYFDYIEGPEPYVDSNSNGKGDPGEFMDLNGDGLWELNLTDVPVGNAWTMIGDLGDVVSFTTRRNQPFIGVLEREPFTDSNGNGTFDPGTDRFVDLNGDGVYTTTPVQFQSNVAEVAWWVQFDDLNGNGQLEENEMQSRVLRRRAVLVRPDLDVSSFAMAGFFQRNDLSAHPVTVNNQARMQSNSLSDLTQRPARFGHDGRTWPQGTVQMNMLTHFALTGPRFGEDIVLSNVLAFDVRAWDPTAEVRRATSGEAVFPGDPGWIAATGSVIGRGAFVDLNYFGQFVQNYFFAGPPDPKSGKNWPTYDTGSTGDFGPYASDGIDNNNDGVVDDPSERTTAIPYPYPLRGLQIRIRVYDPDTRQVRQSSVVADFVPE